MVCQMTFDTRYVVIVYLEEVCMFVCMIVCLYVCMFVGLDVFVCVRSGWLIE